MLSSSKVSCILSLCVCVTNATVCSQCADNSSTSHRSGCVLTDCHGSPWNGYVYTHYKVLVVHTYIHPLYSFPAAIPPFIMNHLEKKNLFKVYIIFILYTTYPPLAALKSCECTWALSPPKNRKIWRITNLA